MQETTIKQNLTTAEAIALIKTAKRGTQFALHVRGDAPTSETTCFPGGLASWMPLTKAQALQLAGSLLSATLEARGGRIPMRTCTREITGTTIWINS